MPFYDLRNKLTQEVVNVMMGIAEKEEYLENNPEWEQVIGTALHIGDSVSLGIKKPPSDFQKYVLGRIKEAVPGTSAVGNKRFSIPREF